MKLAEIAELTGTTIDQVREAMRGAEKFDIFNGQKDDGSPKTQGAWFVAVRSGGAYGSKFDRLANAVGKGTTRHDAVVRSLMNAQNWR